MGKARERYGGIANHFTSRCFAISAVVKVIFGNFCAVAVDLANAAYYKGRRIQFNPKFAWQKLCASG